MNNNFKPDELIKVQGKQYPVVGGRLRLAHEDNQALNIETNIVQYDGTIAVIQATVRTDKGTYNGLGNSTITRDARLKVAILELAETRAIARALRFAGYGVEYTGFEEMPSHQTNEEEAHEAEMLNEKISEDSAAVLEQLIIQKGGEVSRTLKHYKVSKLSELTVGQAGELKQKLAEK